MFPIEKSQTSARIGRRRSDRLFDFVRQRGGQFSHHVHTVDVREISFQLAKSFTLLLGVFLFRYIHRDADVFTDFLRGVVMSDATQKSDGAVRPTNPKFDIVIRAFSDRIPEFCTDHRFVFGKNRVVIVVEWNRALARIEAIQAGVLVRRMNYLSSDQIARPAASMSQALTFREVCLFPSELLRE